MIGKLTIRWSRNSLRVQGEQVARVGLILQESGKAMVDARQPEQGHRPELAGIADHCRGFEIGHGLHRPPRGGGSARGGAARTGWGDLRAYSPRRHARSPRGAVLQRRRLGGKLHRAGGASRRSAGNPALDSSADRGGGDAGTPPLAGDAAGSGMGGRFLIPFVDGIWLGGRLLTLREW